MNWYLIWAGWLLACIVSFGILEGWALATGNLSLSRFTFNLTQAWPLLPWVLGCIAGGLAVHFWWHWAPPGSSSGG